jgi:acetolactate synthase small subunit
MMQEELKKLVNESMFQLLLEVDVEDISQEEIVVGDNGFNYLKQKVEELNKRALRWKIPPMELKTVKEELVKKTIYRTLSGKVVSNPSAYPDAEAVEVNQKQYTVKIEGKPPRVEGYEFLAKIEHTDGGNIINVAPHASLKNLPPEFKSANSECDVCHTKRERFNTFILKKEVDGTFVKAGSTCLKRFLPAISVNALINYAAMLEEMREGLASGGFDNDDDAFDVNGMPNKYRNYMEMDRIMGAIASAYLMKRKYISKTKAVELNTESTVDMATSILFPPRTEDERGKEFYQKAREKMSGEGKVLGDKVIDWAKTYDFTADAEAKPQYENLFNNMQVLAHASSANLKNMSYIGAIFGKYLHTMNMTQKKADDANKKPSEYIGTIGAKVADLHVKLLKLKEYENQFTGGMSAMYSFEDKEGNRIMWFSSRPIEGMVEGTEYIIKGTIKNQAISKYGGHKETTMRNVKVASLDGNKLN